MGLKQIYVSKLLSQPGHQVAILEITACH